MQILRRKCLSVAVSVPVYIVSLCVDCMCVSVGTHSALVLAELVNRNSSSHLNWRGIRDDL